MGGKRLQNIEDAETVEVGKFYLVPTVLVPTLPQRISIVPVVGPLHEDMELIGVPDKHLHPDRRFVSKHWLEYYNLGKRMGHWSPVYAYRWRNQDTGMRDNGRLSLKCKNIVDSFPIDGVPWLPRLENAYAGETLREGMICPHRGISCRGVVVDSQNCVVCPGHGLQWNITTGQLVSRIGPTIQCEVQ